jgi:hypothetical protein
MSILLDLLALGVLISSLLAVGEWLDRKIQFFDGIGSIIIYLTAQTIFSCLALNPFGSQNLWAFQSYLLWGTLAVASFVLLIQQRHQSRWVWDILTLVTLGLGVFLFLQPGERTWDGAGYHNPISLLIYQSGNYWDWPNLMWAQWFPAGQETVAASFLVFFSSYNGLIVPTIIWSVLLINFIIKVISDVGATRWIKTVSVIFATTIPFLLPQTGTSYVDIQMGIAFMLICYIVSKIFLINSFRWFNGQQVERDSILINCIYFQSNFQESITQASSIRSLFYGNWFGGRDFSNSI